METVSISPLVAGLSVSSQRARVVKRPPGPKFKADFSLQKLSAGLFDRGLEFKLLLEAGFQTLIPSLELRGCHSFQAAICSAALRLGAQSMTASSTFMLGSSWCTASSNTSQNSFGTVPLSRGIRPVSWSSVLLIRRQALLTCLHPDKM